MGVAFTNTANMRVSFGTTSAVQQLQNKTILIWAYLSTLGGGDFCGAYPNGGLTHEFWSTFIGSSGSEDDRFSFFANFNTTDGSWSTTNVVSSGLRHFGVTYNYTSASNNPILYVDGASVGVTETSTPVGSYQTGTDSIFRLGSVFNGFPSFNGTLLSLCIYNRIMSAAEVADAFNSRLYIPNYHGLVF